MATIVLASAVVLILFGAIVIEFVSGRDVFDEALAVALGAIIAGMFSGVV